MRLSYLNAIYCITRNDMEIYPAQQHVVQLLPHCPVDQLADRPTLDREVEGSTPSGAAKLIKILLIDFVRLGQSSFFKHLGFEVVELFGLFQAEDFFIVQRPRL